MKETFWEEMAEEEKKNPKIYYIACLKLLKEKKKLKRVPILDCHKREIIWILSL